MGRAKVRYEWRAWASAFPDLPNPATGQESSETYFLLPGHDGCNLKLREGRLELKRLAGVSHGLQRWRFSPAKEFPLAVDDLPPPVRACMASVEFLPGEHELRAALRRAGLAVVDIRKLRRLFSVDGCQAEVTLVEQAGAMATTAAIEAETLDAARQAVASLELDRWPNRAYPAALAAWIAGRLTEVAPPPPVSQLGPATASGRAVTGGGTSLEG